MSAPTLYDFGAGPVPAHRHRNPNGSEGGWVADTATVHPTAIVAVGACVGPGARVGAHARIATSRDCMVLTWGSFAGTAYPVVGDVIVRYGCEVHPLGGWTDDAIDAMCRRHRPHHAAVYAAVLRAWVALVRATIRPAPAEVGLVQEAK